MEESIIRENLINQKDYKPYCGSVRCVYRMPRALWDPAKKQFTCSCGWISEFPDDFIDRYIKKWKA